MNEDKEVLYLEEILHLKKLINNIYDYCIECDKSFEGVCISGYIKQMILKNTINDIETIRRLSDIDE